MPRSRSCDHRDWAEYRDSEGHERSPRFRISKACEGIEGIEGVEGGSEGDGRIIMATLTREEAASRLREVNGWTLEGDAIRKQFVFRGFPDAVDFVSRLVPHAEAADHHPDVLINYKRVTLTYSTHSEGGLTPKDFDGAKMADKVAAEKAV
jgi:4a-hydroxytetrahydrobiopterin dehydratase